MSRQLPLNSIPGQDNEVEALSSSDASTSLLPSHNTQILISVQHTNLIPKTRETVSCIYKLIAEKVGPHNKNLESPAFFSKKTLASVIKLGATASVYSALYASLLFSTRKKNEDVTSERRAEACQRLAGELVGFLLENRDQVVEKSEILRDCLAKEYSVGAARKNALEIALLSNASSFLAYPLVQQFVKSLWRNGQSLSNGVLDDSIHLIADKSSQFSRIIETPRIQNTVTLLVNLIFVGLYTFVVNFVEYKSDVPVFTEWILYIWSFAFFLEEIVEMRQRKWSYFSTLSSYLHLSFPLLLLVSFTMRMVTLLSSYKMEVMQRNSGPCDILSMAAPFVYLNIISWFDAFNVCGKTMIIVQTVIKKSLWMVMLVPCLIVGFGQALWTIGENEDFGFLVDLLARVPNHQVSSHFSPITGRLLFISYMAVILILVTNLLIAVATTSYAKLIPTLDAEYALHFTAKTLYYYRTKYVFPAPTNLLKRIVDVGLNIFRRKRSQQLDWVVQAEWFIIFFPVVLGLAGYNFARVKIYIPTKSCITKYWNKSRFAKSNSVATSSITRSNGDDGDATIAAAMINGEDEKDFLEPETRELTRDLQLSRILDALLRIEGKIHHMEDRLEALEHIEENRHSDTASKLIDIDQISRLQNDTLNTVTQLQGITLENVCRIQNETLQHAARTQSETLETVKKVDVISTTTLENVARIQNETLQHAAQTQSETLATVKKVDVVSNATLENVARIQNETLQHAAKTQDETLATVKQVDVKQAEIRDELGERLPAVEIKQREIETKVLVEVLPKVEKDQAKLEKRLGIVESVFKKEYQGHENFDWFGKVM